MYLMLRLQVIGECREFQNQFAYGASKLDVREGASTVIFTAFMVRHGTVRQWNPIGVLKSLACRLDVFTLVAEYVRWESIGVQSRSAGPDWTEMYPSRRIAEGVDGRMYVVHFRLAVSVIPSQMEVQLVHSNGHVVALVCSACRKTAIVVQGE